MQRRRGYFAVVVVAVALGGTTVRAQIVGPMPERPVATDTPSTDRHARVREADMPLGSGSATGEPRALGDNSGASSAIGIGRTIGALAVVLGLAVAGYGALRFLSRRHAGLAVMFGPGGRAPSGLLEVLGRYPVGRGQTLVLLRVDRRVLLVAQCAGGRAGPSFKALCEMTDAEDVASILAKTRDDVSDRDSGRFASLMRRYDDPMPGAADIPIVDLTGDDVDGPLDAIKRVWARMGRGGRP